VGEGSEEVVSDGAVAAGASRLTSLLGNSQRLDGGAMFGNAPKAVWSKWIAPDDANRIPLACRCLLIEEPAGRRILLETGIGAFFAPKMRERFGVVESRHVLVDQLAKAGLTPSDVDVVVLSHLHFDHAGGLLAEHREDEPLRLIFDRAHIVVGEDAWRRANAPHSRDRASFIPELQPLLSASGRLEIVTGDTSATLGAKYRLHFSHGHTPGLMLVEVPATGGPIVFGGDLIPGMAWVHLPITMGYDRYPELLIDEKRALLGDLAARNGRVFFTHDAAIACARIAPRDGGSFQGLDGVAELRASI
jgi:glyoxylase-like metal-dependent hydrolase (beta-lactamase superfamily II)